MNSTRASDSQSFFILAHLFEGLTRNGPKTGEIIPGIAEKWEINDAGATFHLRKNALWSDGKPVTAADFVFAWRLVVDPRNASEYAFIMYPIKNARLIHDGKLSAQELGVSAPDSRTLKVVFEKPCAYFLYLTAFGSYYPVREDFYRANPSVYGTDVAHLLSDGPFVLSTWEHGRSLLMDKNPKYWNVSNIKLDAIDIPYITPDNSALFQLFQEGKTDLVERLGKSVFSQALKAKGSVQTFVDGSVWFLEFNFRKGRPTSNLNLRLAIRAAVSLVQKTFISKVVDVPETIMAQTLIPDWMPGVKHHFREDYPYAVPQYTLVDAKRFVAAAQKELGGKIPPLVLLTSNTTYSSREADYFKSLLANDLGIDLRIEQQSQKSMRARMELGEFDILSTGWAPDYDDPMTFVDLMASWNENNRGHFSDVNLDWLILEAQGTVDQAKRMKAMADAERLILDQVAVIPIYQRVVAYVVNDKKLKGVVRRSVGSDPDLIWATVSP
ncbi:MAG: peptide ABC transporter substrate-binding protein [Oligoflexia bacterium]|nr:peptide ABC transporter substrate-binding protein [Oligoflexia bacterium]